MRIYPAALLIASFLQPAIAFSQDNVKTDEGNLGFSVGLTEYQVRDEVLNPIRHRGLSISFGVSHERPREISNQKFDLQLIFNSIGSRFDPEKDSFALNTIIRYRYARRVGDLNPEVNLFLGGFAGLNSNVGFFENWDESHAYWLTSYDIGFAGILTYQKTDHGSFELEIDIPILSLVSRPPERILYKESNPEFSWIMGRLHENLTLTSLHRHVDLNLNLRYLFRYSDRFDQTLFWRFRYLNNDLSYSRRLTVLSHTFGATFLF